jgi:hypothetical protein
MAIEELDLQGRLGSTPAVPPPGILRKDLRGKGLASIDGLNPLLLPMLAYELQTVDAMV